jgi:hypothetical protein
VEMNLPEPRTPRGCSRPLKACAVILALVVVAVILLFWYALRMPAMRALVQCQTNMMAVGQALQRYEDVNGVYPKDLDTLKKDYLKDDSVLRCPLVKPDEEGSCYIYHRPGPGADDKFVILECDLHKTRGEVPIKKLQLLKDGTVNAEGLPLDEAIKESEKRKR